ncbi:hypothetical protein [Bradyrhizobium japonicum]|uniref:hypothetical protein n=1 Tax=Bradyrhizobium japonicum TaxID=375 RepID=UPI0004007DDA|nr:hypothetical protein [Bradyrhizobium japonicum]WLB91318.1 hypothetical protein QIH91_13400 [Bradyrhizobium japonicum USDA 135]
MIDEDRLTLICDQVSPAGAATAGAVPLTGIDFIQIVAPALQTRLRVFFIVDPDRVLDPDDPGVAAKFLAVFPTPTSTPAFPIDKVSIASAIGETVPVTQARWRHVAVDLAGTQLRTVLEIDVAHPGDFSVHRLTLQDPVKPPDKSRFDAFFNAVQFSFKQGCPSVFDCRRELVCPDESLVDFPVDYLARDFVSLRNALMDFAAQKYPLYRERIPADQLVMIAELLAALGDELAYVQDWCAREGTMETAQEMRSLRRQCRLLDFDIDNGQSADTWLALEVKAGVTLVPPGARVWAIPVGQPPIAYEIGRGLAERRPLTQPIYVVDPTWNRLDPHIADPGAPCLPFGSTEIIVKGHLNEAVFAGKPILIALDPAEAGKPRHRHIAHVEKAIQGSDPLILDAGGAPQDFTRLILKPADALPFESCLPETRVFANLLPAVAGETRKATFSVGDNSSLSLSDRLKFPLAVEREGLLDTSTGTRATTFLFSLLKTETAGLGWIDGRPEVDLEEVNVNENRQQYWDYEPSLLAGRSENPIYTLEDGTYRRVIRFLVNGEWVEVIDRASGRGFTIRFGDSEFGMTPTDGTLFRATYRTGPLAGANLAAETVIVLNQPPGAELALTLLGNYATNVFNPLPITSGRDQMDLQTIKFMAPDAWRVRVERAVRDEDFREIAERFDWVSKAGARARWTGSWLTEFVTADPVGRYNLAPDQYEMLAARMNCVRQAGRDVVVSDPVYAALDLFVQICVNANAHPGDVIKRVTTQLLGPARPGHKLPFFDQARFTFATPLSRLALEAAIQEVAGVRAVKDVRVRIRGQIDWHPLEDAPLDPGTDRIFRLQNDPDRPEAGSLLVTDKEWADAGMLSM